MKICGITDISSALFAIDSGADALGFVFAESKRQISLQHAKDIIAKLPRHVEKVGVFVNEDSNIIHNIAEEVGLTMIQLHGDETPEDCEHFTLPVIKALGISSEEDCLRIRDYHTSYILLDSPKGKFQGGNGVSFPWNLVNERFLVGKKLILAGGLKADNVQQAIKSLDPYMVDVSSGVETNGIKDNEKIKEFIRKAKQRQGRIHDDNIYTT